MKAVGIVAWIVMELSLTGACGKALHEAQHSGDAAHAYDAAEASDASGPSTADIVPGARFELGRQAGVVDADVDQSLQDGQAGQDDAGHRPDAEETVDEPADAPMPDPTDSSDDGAVDGGAAPRLAGAPLVFAPTGQGFGLNVALLAGQPSALRAHVRRSGTTTWTELGQPAMPAFDVAEWLVTGLEAGQRYEYQILDSAAPDAEALSTGTVGTKRGAGASFTFDLLTDSHIPACDTVPAGNDICGNDYLSADEATLLQVAADIRTDQPDFVIHMGDMLDFHRFGFNEPPPDSHWSRLAYLNYRRLMTDTLGVAAHFLTIGNWEGENGCNSADEIERSSSQRMAYVPGPQPRTYPEGGSPNQDYYAFTWGDALFVVLNVMTYTPTCHLLSSEPGVGGADDWTLGASQRAWLESTLAGATSKWRFTFIHHTVGGNAGDEANSAYGRGGGRAARVGEQSVIHEMLRRYGVQIFFYGHDHVFTDMVVDGIHYTLPGSAGAPWKFDTSVTGYAEYWPDSGHARVTISPMQVQVDFVALGGSLLSSYSLH